MATLRVAGFNGANLALHPKLLAETVGVSSTNQWPGRGDLRPLCGPLNVATVPAGQGTIYRLGKDVASDSATWLSWANIVYPVRGFIADDTSERTYYTGEGVAKWTDTVKVLVSPRLLGVPAPAAAPTVVASGGVSTTTESRFYCATFVTDAGEESAPSPVSTQLDCKLDATVAISALSAAPAGNFGITLRRIYRTVSSTSGTEFFFLREIASSLTTTSDDLRAVGEVLATTTWLTPPGAAQGGALNTIEPVLSNLTGMWNGMMAGISGRTVRYCESYVPYAWPAAYETSFSEGTPVALATFGQNLLVLTTSRPRIVTGGSPDSLDDQPLEFRQACVAPRSVVSMGHGVVYACPDGLAYVGTSGYRMLTQGLMMRDDWQALVPATMVGAQYEGNYIAFYNDGVSTKGLMIDPINPQGVYFLDFGYTASHLDDINDALYVLDGVNVRKWNKGSTLTTTFKSKEFRMPQPMPGFACAEVVAGSYPATFKLYADGVLKHTQTVASRTSFRLPGGYHANDFQIEVSTSGTVQAVVMAHSMTELATS